MKKILILFVCLSLFIVIATKVLVEETESVEILPPTVGQTYGPGNTIIMWHDIDDDGHPDYKATYIFKFHNY